MTAPAPTTQDRPGGLRRRALALVATLALVAVALQAPVTADEDDGGSWPYARHDAASTAHQERPGHITDPEVLDRAYLGGSLGELIPVDLEGDGDRGFLALDGGRVTAYDGDFAPQWQSPLIRPQGISGVADLDGDGTREVVGYTGVDLFVLSGSTGELLWSEAVPGTTQALTRQGVRIVDLVPGQAGAQVFAWGSSAFGTLFGFDDGFDAVTELWRTPSNQYAEAYIPGVVVGDINADGDEEIVIATCGSVISYDGETGAELSGGAGWNGRVDWISGPGVDCRNYGNLYLEDLQDDGYPEVIMIADGVTLHLAQLDNGPDGLSLAYDEFIEHPENARTLRSTYNSVGDLTGDGAIEIAYNIYNRDGAEQWEILVFDAAEGTADPIAVLEDAYLRGVQDVTGDGVRDLLVADSPTRVPSSFSTIRALSFDPSSGAYAEAWSATDARWRVVSAPFDGVPETISPAGRNAANEVLTSAGLSAGGLAAFVEFGDGSTAAYDLADSAGTEVWRRDSGSALWQGEAGGAERVAVQQGDGFVSYEGVDGFPVAQIPTGSLTGAPTVGPLGGERNSVVVPGAGEVKVFDSTALGLTERWSVEGHGSYVFLGSKEAVPIVDLEGDGSHGLVLADSHDGSSRLRYLDGDGEPIWDSVMPDLPEVSPGNGLYSWAAGNLRGGDTQDLYVAAFAGGYNTEVSRIVDGTDGSVVSSRNDNPLNPGIGFGPWTGNPGIADADGDGQDEAYFLAKDITYRVVDGDLSAVEQVLGHQGLYHNPAFVDLTGDGSVELLMTGGFNGFDAVEFDDDDPDGRTLWYHPTDPSDMLGRIAASADVDGDGALEVATLHADGFIRLWDGASGNLIDEHDAGRPGSSVVSGDVTGDGEVNLLYGTDDGRLEALGWDGSGLSVRWSLDIGYQIGDLALADVMGDAASEVVLTAADGFLYVVGDASDPGPVSAELSEGGGALVAGRSIPVTVELAHPDAALVADAAEGLSLRVTGPDGTVTDVPVRGDARGRLVGVVRTDRDQPGPYLVELRSGGATVPGATLMLEVGS